MKKNTLLVLFILISCSLFGQDTIPGRNIKKILPVLYHQYAPEYKALCYQAFNMATLQLEKVKKEKKGLPLAIITDIDETILDNSYHEAQMIKNGKEYSSQSWNNWVNTEAATLIPGVLEFLNKAKKSGVEIFYVSNRKSGELENTISNFKKLGVPYADLEHMFFQQGESSKEDRRKNITKRFNVIMLIGDNLNDFSTVFETKDGIERKSQVDLYKNDWGTKFIVLPNVIYGDWENALYNYENDLNDKQKNEILMEKLIGY